MQVEMKIKMRSSLHDETLLGDGDDVCMAIFIANGYWIYRRSSHGNLIRKRQRTRNEPFAGRVASVTRHHHHARPVRRQKRGGCRMCMGVCMELGIRAKTMFQSPRNERYRINSDGFVPNDAQQGASGGMF